MTEHRDENGSEPEAPIMVDAGAFRDCQDRELRAGHRLFYPRILVSTVQYSVGLDEGHAPCRRLYHRIENSCGYSRHSFPWSFAPFSGRIWSAQPERGDVVVFRKPSDLQVDYIKRVIGLPGDHIQMVGGTLHINGRPVKVKKIEPFSEEESDCPLQQPVQRYLETLPGGATHDILACDPKGPLNDTSEYVVPPAHYFMMGDNRDDSADSRDPSGGVGFVPEENLIGKAQYIFFSPVCYDDGTCKAQIWEFWKWPWAIRYERFFQSIK